MLRKLLNLVGLSAVKAVTPKPAVKRSSQWPRVRAEHLKREPFCQACGAGTKLEVHHLMPVHAGPSLELDPSNLLTLCEGDGCNCHFTFGHCLNWKAWNPNAVLDAAWFLRKVRNRSTKGD